MDTENSGTNSHLNLTEENSDLRTKIGEYINASFSIQDLPKLTEEINSDDLLSQLHGTIGVRKLLSVGIFIIRTQLIFLRN